jgi:hypothetical protein
LRYIRTLSGARQNHVDAMQGLTREQRIGEIRKTMAALDLTTADLVQHPGTQTGRKPKKQEPDNKLEWKQGATPKLGDGVKRFRWEAPARKGFYSCGPAYDSMSILFAGYIVEHIPDKAKPTHRRLIGAYLTPHAAMAAAQADHNLGRDAPYKG